MAVETTTDTETGAEHLTREQLLARLEAARDDLNFAIGCLHGLEANGAVGADSVRHWLDAAHRKLYDGIPHRIERPEHGSSAGE